MKALAINGSPRKRNNTASLLEHMLDGAKKAGAETELIHLVDLQYKGCISCFACKLIDGPSYGRCPVPDGLQPVLQKAHEADVLILGSPLYFMTDTALMRGLMERLWFQYHRYSLEKGPLSPKKTATALVYTMNVGESDANQFGLGQYMETNRQIMERMFGRCDLLCSYNTLQFADYTKVDNDYFDVEEKQRKHREDFPAELERARELGAGMAGRR